MVEQYHASGTSGRHPEGSSAPSAHISAHPAVHTIETKSRQARTRRLRIPFRNRMDEYHEKARKRADKNPIKGAKGAAAPKRMGPRGEDTVPFWGVKVPLAGPWASATAAATTAAIYAMPPGEVNTGPGSVGSCAAGTCGGSGGCGSETLGMCTAGCTGVSSRVFQSAHHGWLANRKGVAVWMVRGLCWLLRIRSRGCLGLSGG